MAVSPRRAASLNDTHRRTRDIVTPEGVPITVEIAAVSERASAFLLDTVFWNVLVFVMVLPIFYLTRIGSSMMIAIGLASLVSFLIRNTYFIHFELLWGGATPGKRIMGLRVIDREGGPLLPTAVIARNMTREFEIFMPLMVLLSLGNVTAGEWAHWLAAAWLLVIGAIPFINFDRMRGGDLIGGTMVVAVQRQALLEDQARDEFRYTFTHRELSAYGAYELQVLEQVLRNARTMSNSAQIMTEIGGRIRRKIGWRGEVPPEMEDRFLRDFYTAERAFLEREQLFGKTKADKNDGAEAEGGPG